jgi:Zinc-ribbon containing domain/Protein of unknown function (DUF2934)
MAKAGSSKKSPGKTASGSIQQSPLISSEERQRMIAEVAYFRAMQRGFTNGDPLDDWLAAEREISRLLPNPQQQKQERAAYEKLREGVRKILAESRDTLTPDTIRQALDRGAAQLKQLGGYTADTIDKVRAGVEKDMAVAAAKIGPRWQAFSEKTADLFQVWRDRGQQYLSDASRVLGDWLRDAGDRMKQHTYRAGEMTAGGTLECTRCGEHIVLATSAHLPPCPKCRNLEFRRI